MEKLSLNPYPPVANPDTQPLKDILELNRNKLQDYINTFLFSGSTGIIMSPGLELYNPSSTPYIDFHHAANAAGDGGADYDVRLISNAADVLTFTGGRFVVDGAVADAVSIEGVLANLKLTFRDDLAHWYAVYANAVALRFWQNITSIDSHIFYTNGVTEMVAAKLGPANGLFTPAADYAAFSHINAWATGTYALLQYKDGTTYINSATARSIFFRNNNATIGEAGIVSGNGAFSFGGSALDFESVTATGPVAGFAFRDRNDPTNGAKKWVWYNINQLVRLWNGSIGDAFTFDTSGVIGGVFGAAPGLRTRGSGNAVSFNWTGTFQMWVDATNVKNFIIDHPVDPDRHLIHTTLEGPENAVFYRGEAQLSEGWAEIELPSYFEALCAVEGRSVQLTCIADNVQDEWCPVLHATYPEDGKFHVGLGSGMVIPDQRFWWEVKAVRKDVDQLLVEPRRDEVFVHGDGPYKYYSKAS